MPYFDVLSRNVQLLHVWHIEIMTFSYIIMIYFCIFVLGSCVCEKMSRNLLQVWNILDAFEFVFSCRLKLLIAI